MWIEVRNGINDVIYINADHVKRVIAPGGGCPPWAKSRLDLGEGDVQYCTKSVIEIVTEMENMK